MVLIDWNCHFGYRFYRPLDLTAPVHAPRRQFIAGTAEGVVAAEPERGKPWLGIAVVPQRWRRISRTSKVTRTVQNRTMWGIFSLRYCPRTCQRYLVAVVVVFVFVVFFVSCFLLALYR